MSGSLLAALSLVKGKDGYRPGALADYLATHDCLVLIDNQIGEPGCLGYHITGFCFFLHGHPLGKGKSV